MDWPRTQAYHPTRALHGTAGTWRASVCDLSWRLLRGPEPWAEHGAPTRACRRGPHRGARSAWSQYPGCVALLADAAPAYGPPKTIRLRAGHLRRCCCIPRHCCCWLSSSSTVTVGRPVLRQLVAIRDSGPAGAFSLPAMMASVDRTSLLLGTAVWENCAGRISLTAAALPLAGPWPALSKRCSAARSRVPVFEHV